MRSLRLLCYVLLLVAAPVARAGKGLDLLQSYTSSLKTLQAGFTQTQFDDKMRQLQVTSGEFFLKKPGRFRWEYKQPYSQLIVSDGKSLWIYDPELEQAVLKPLDQALGATPIALLTGEQPLQEQFNIVELSNIDGREFVQLEPKVKDTDYALMLLALTDKGLEAMELKDRLGQVTRIELLQPRLNVDIDDARFNFKPPKGVDIVRE
ncbi:MAG TPA: outer membrane lipoprotein chaperone LolA [Gammaproteobacteria bacterium]|nr:outer membrane lipoprotein chaperone LolA [Gammaproteobacteria bacterium]